MNQTAAATSNSTGMLASSSYGTITAVHLVLIALFALLVLAGIVYGARLKHRRVAAAERVEEHATEAGVPLVEPDDTEPSLPADRDKPSPAAAADAPAPAPAPIAAAPFTDEPQPAVVDEAMPDHAAPPLPPVPASAPESAPAASGAAQPVTQLKGLGPKVAGRLGELGITTVGQIAALTDDQAERLDAQLGAFTGRLIRDRWVEQARFLAAGDRQGFEAVFGKL